jgi:NADPH:quinone reductase-like Zn-dependent oxidoreductase
MGVMRAIVYSSYGPPEVLQLAEVAEPVPGDDEVLIRVRAVEATKSDCEMRGFQFAVKWFWLPLRIALGITKPKRRILGGYFAGEIAAVGKAVRELSPGDRVFGSAGLRMGAYAEYMTLPARACIARMPSNMSFAEAAAVPLGGMNALHFMRLANIRPGESVAINGAGGSIGAHAVQIAKAMGAQVTAVDSAYKRDLTRLGADHFIDYAQESFTAAGRSYDVIFDMVASSSYAACIAALKPNGRYFAGNPRLSVMLRSAITTRTSDKTASFAFAAESPAALQALSEMIERGELRSIVDTVYPLTAAATAHARVEQEQRIGAIVLSLDREA